MCVYAYMQYTITMRFNKCCPSHVPLKSPLKPDISHRHELSKPLNGASLGGSQNLMPLPGLFSSARLKGRGGYRNLWEINGNDHDKFNKGMMGNVYATFMI